MNNFQRKGSKSNTDVGQAFRKRVRDMILARHRIVLHERHSVLCSLRNNQEKTHRFALGSDNPPVIVTCKTHKWTSGDNMPSAKIHAFAVAMFHFHMAPSKYRKIFVCEQSLRKKDNKSLLEYFLDKYFYLIPPDVELWELPPDSDAVRIIRPA